MATINGTAANDTLNGTDILTEEDTIFGLAGDDTLRGLAGRDFLVGGAGNDTLDGGAHPAGSSDLAIYSTTLTGAGAIIFDLAAGTSTDGLGGTDTLINIEGVIGSSSADILRGDANGSNYLEGGGGNDIIDGRGSNIAGARFADFAGYFNSPAGATVDLEAGTASDGFGGTDTITNTDGIIGANLFADILRGNDRDNILIGYGGNDILDGRGGRDLISYFLNTVAGVTVDLAAGTASGGSAGNDTLISIENVDGSNLFADTLLGNASDNTLAGFGGNDTLDGKGGNDFALYAFSPASVTVDLLAGTASDGHGGTDTLSNIEYVIGSAFNDTLSGNDGNNALFGQGGNDILDGRGGADFASYVFSTGAATVNLATGTASDGQGGTDTLISIENAEGSGFADTLTGNSANNTLQGLGGNDILDGGGGTDYASYFFSPGAASVNLATGTANDGHGGTDTLSNIENVTGSAFNDTITGNAGGNTLLGMGGNDIIDGGGGADFVGYFFSTTGAATVNLATGTASDGQGGTDTLINIENVAGSAFGDTITGNAGDNTLQGLGGNDILDGGGGIDLADYFFSPAGVTVNLATGTASDGHGGTDTLISIENVRGSGFADSITGAAGSNLFFARGGNDTLNGGTDIDTAQYQGARSGYTIAGTNTARTVTDNTANRDGTDALGDVERLKFSDGVLAFDSGIEDAAGRGYLIYRAAFDRTPDAEGLGYWINELDRGQDFGAVVAASFIASPEFITKYGTGTSNTEFVTLVYQNVLDRAPDAEGLDYWLTKAGEGGVGLNGGYARSNMLASFAIGSENVAAVSAEIANGIFFTPFV